MATEGEEVMTTAGISIGAYPPYPRTKTAYYNIIQDLTNRANVRGYDRGVKDSREKTSRKYTSKINRCSL